MPLLILRSVLACFLQPGVPFHLHLALSPITCLHLSSMGSWLTPAPWAVELQQMSGGRGFLQEPSVIPGQAQEMNALTWLSPSIPDRGRLKPPCQEAHSGFPQAT